MGQACKNPQVEVVPGLPTSKPTANQCDTASIEQKT